MQVIKLNHETWEIDTSKALGPPGGFGEVFRGKGVNGDVAIKRLMVTASDAAHRESPSSASPISNPSTLTLTDITSLCQFASVACKMK